MEFLPFIVIIVLFYFLLIRPQQKRAKQARELQLNLQPGDKVMLTAGVFGTVTEVEETTTNIKVEIADGVVIQVVRQAVAQKVDVVPADEIDEADETEETDEASDDAVEAPAEKTSADADNVIVDLDKKD
ncbi:preprotein translocase subunit YajC [Nocardioides albertanoniae]|uniref:Preprotein translocase subunit YajC n=1 Tax=Nocardioides albertanoniae TaxID=1175486 RepID=A0A543A6P6_9ACTN|nr:preprotein translocase subunit YajC [Nocardioides albertanoniae]TQL68281.1 preprotein translocase subunit YajC [Nocardioides albertanoniae]